MDSLVILSLAYVCRLLQMTDKVEMNTFSTVALTRSLCCRPKPRVRFDEMGVEEGGLENGALCLVPSPSR
jgi:hypothetical protein